MISSKNTLDAQGFRLIISTQKNDLTLEAQQKSTGKTFMIQLTGDLILQGTNTIFSTAEKMAEGMMSAIRGSEDLEFTIDSQGKLTFSALFKAGKIEKKESFALSLCEKKMEPIEILNSRLVFFKDDTEQWKGEQERKMKEGFDRLEIMMKQMEQKINQKLDLLTELSSNLKASIILKPSIYFNHNSANVPKFILSDENKTASLKDPKEFFCLEILPQIPSKGKQSYSLRINKITKILCFGISTETTEPNWNDKKCNYRYLTSDGRIRGREEKGPNGNGSFGGNDKVLKMVVDMDQGTLTFFLDKIKVNACSISKSDKYFAYVTLGEAGDSVTLI